MGSARPLRADVLVIGGGPAGSAAARVLAEGGAAVVVAERSNFDRFRVGETLPPEATPLLRRLGAAGVLDESAHIRSPGTVATWGGDEPHENDFIFSPHGLGWHLDRRRFDEALARLAEAAGAKVLTGTRPFNGGRGEDGGWTVTLADDRRRTVVNARFLIDATGRSSWSSRESNSPRVVHDRLVGIVGAFDRESEDPRTFLESRPEGWWYSAPLPGGRMIAAFFTDVDLHELSQPGRRALWHEQLETSRLTRERIGDIPRKLDPGVVSASSSILGRVSGRRWFAVGDSACTLDPLSSQGICWAIASGIRAAEAILEGGDEPDGGPYEADLNDRFNEYLRMRLRYYSAERRWPDSPFWQRRRGETGRNRRPPVLDGQKSATKLTRTGRGDP